MVIKLKKKFLIIIFFLILFFFIFPYSSFAASTTTYYFDSIEKTYDENGALLETKVYYPSSEVTLQKTVKRDGSKQMVYLYPDHLGSIILTTDYQGNKLSSSFYYPYGADFNIPSSPSSLNNITNQQYTSQKKDLSTSLYYYHARYYNPKTAHFISADKAEGPNRYAYVGNNPIMRNDPSGMMIAKDDTGGNSNTSKIPLVRMQQNTHPIIQATGVLDNTNYIALPGQSYCELNPGKCVPNEAGFRNTMGVALGISLLPLALTSYPVYEVADLAVCIATSDPATCGMTAIAPGPAVRSPKITLGSQLTSKTGINGSGAIVYRGLLDNQEAAIKLLKDTTSDFGKDYLAREIRNAQLISDWGIGPRFFGAVEVNGQRGYAMSIVEGDFPEAMTDFINDQTFADLKHIINTILEKGYDIGDFQYFVTPQGRAVMIDPGALLSNAEKQARGINFNLLDLDYEIERLKDLIRK